MALLLSLTLHLWSWHSTALLQSPQQLKIQCHNHLLNAFMPHLLKCFTPRSLKITTLKANFTTCFSWLLCPLHYRALHHQPLTSRTNIQRWHALLPKGHFWLGWTPPNLIGTRQTKQQEGKQGPPWPHLQGWRLGPHCHAHLRTTQATKNLLPNWGTIHNHQSLPKWKHQDHPWQLQGNNQHSMFMPIQQTKLGKHPTVFFYHFFTATKNHGGAYPIHDVYIFLKFEYYFKFINRT